MPELIYSKYGTGLTVGSMPFTMGNGLKQYAAKELLHFALSKLTKEMVNQYD